MIMKTNKLRKKKNKKYRRQKGAERTMADPNEEQIEDKVHSREERKLQAKVRELRHFNSLIQVSNHGIAQRERNGTNWRRKEKHANREEHSRIEQIVSLVSNPIMTKACREW